MSFHRDTNAHTRGAGAIAARDAVKTPAQKHRDARRAQQNRAIDRVRQQLTAPRTRAFYTLGAISTEDPTGGGHDTGGYGGGGTHYTPPRPIGTPPRPTSPTHIALPGQITRPPTRTPIRLVPTTVRPIKVRPPGTTVIVTPTGTAVPIVPAGGGGGGGGGGGMPPTAEIPSDATDLEPTDSAAPASSTLLTKRNLLIAGGIVAAYLYFRKKG